MHKKLRALGLVILLSWAPSAGAVDLTGPLRVIDGDTIVIGGEKVRLAGWIDAPEMGQECERFGHSYQCGQEARMALIEVIGGRAVHCVAGQKDKYGRWLGQCSAGQTYLNWTMVRLGWAVMRFERDNQDLWSAQRAAELEKLGLWAGRFEPPWEWRQHHK